MKNRQNGKKNNANFLRKLEGKPFFDVRFTDKTGKLLVLLSAHLFFIGFFLAVSQMNTWKEIYRSVKRVEYLLAERRIASYECHSFASYVTCQSLYALPAIAAPLVSSSNKNFILDETSERHLSNAGRHLLSVWRLLFSDHSTTTNNRQNTQNVYYWDN